MLMYNRLEYYTFTSINRWLVVKCHIISLTNEWKTTLNHCCDLIKEDMFHEKDAGGD